MVAEPGRLGGAFELNGEEGGWEDLIFWLQNQAFRQELSGRSEAERAAARAMAKLVGDIETIARRGSKHLQAGPAGSRNRRSAQGCGGGKRFGVAIHGSC